MAGIDRQGLKGKVQTVTGLIEPATLGQVLMHEHVLCDITPPALAAKNDPGPEITLQTTDQFVTKMFETDPDFVFTVTRDFVRTCQNPVLILPDEVPAHPYAVAMECAMLAPKAEVSIFPWKEPKERIPLAVRQIHSFLKAHRPA